MDEDESQSPGAGPSRSPSTASRRCSISSNGRKGKQRADSTEEAAPPDHGKEENGYAGVPQLERSNSDEMDSSQHSVRSQRSQTSSRGSAQKQDGRSVGSASDAWSEDSEEEDDDEEEDEEPMLKYSRLKGKIPEILAKDQASAIEVGTRVIAIGTVNGMVHILTFEGAKVNSFRPHAGSITCLRMDEENDFIATSSFEGRVVLHSLTTSERYAFDYKRPMTTISLEPDFAKKTTRAFICGGMAGNLIYQEKGWLGYKEQILHSGEGPIWATEWRGNLIAWANDKGVKIYDTSSGQRIGYIDRGVDPPRAELYKPTLFWKDDSTLVIGWADYIKTVRIKTRKQDPSSTGLPSLTVEIAAIYQVDSMISGISPFGPSSFIIVAYIPPDEYDDDGPGTKMEKRQRAANRPELQVIHNGEEISTDAVTLKNFHLYGCNDYALARGTTKQLKYQARGKQKVVEDQVFFVISPADVIVVRPRDEKDHIDWLVEKEKFEEALEAAEKLRKNDTSAPDPKTIGLKYMRHLFDKGEYGRCAGLAPRVLGQDKPEWEKWIDTFTEAKQLNAIIHIIPTDKPQLSPTTYQGVLSQLLEIDQQSLLDIVKGWPARIYPITQIIGDVQDRLNVEDDNEVLVEVLAELYIKNQQPGKAVPLLLQLQRPEVFDLIRNFSLFTAIQDQVLRLVEFDQKRISASGSSAERAIHSTSQHGPAIQLLVDHMDSLPMDRVVSQLQKKPEVLFLYLDAVFEKDPQLCFPYSDTMVELSAEYKPERLLPFLRVSNFYDLEKAYNICKARDLVPEMVFLLGRMGNNRQALMLIIERLGDVQRAIDFAKEQADEDLWEDLLQYSETRPDFIRALLEHVGAEINPIRLIQRIKNGMEIPGLKLALVKILQSSNLQVSLMEGCHRILNGDCTALAKQLQAGQTGAAQLSVNEVCAICGLPAFPPTANPALASLVLSYLCRHVVHAGCALINPDVELPLRPENPAINQLLSTERKGQQGRRREMGSKLSYAAAVRVKVGKCPVCQHASGGHTAITTKTNNTGRIGITA